METKPALSQQSRASSASASHVCIGALGVLAAIAAVEHGVGEIVQGFRPPASVMFPSWPDSPAFASLGGEPAMTLVPNLGVSGILSILLACALAVVAVGYADRRRAGLVLAMISVLLLLAGGGFGPPLIGLLLALTAARVQAHARPPGRIRRTLSRSWRPLLVVTMLAFLGLFPGMVLLYWLAGIDSAGLVAAMIVLAFGGFALTMSAALSYDRLRGTTARLDRTESGGDHSSSTSNSRTTISGVSGA